MPGNEAAIWRPWGNKHENESQCIKDDRKARQNLGPRWHCWTVIPDLDCLPLDYFYRRQINLYLSKLPQLSFLLFAAESIPNTELVTVVQAGIRVVAVKLERSHQTWDILEVEPLGLDGGLTGNRSKGKKKSMMVSSFVSKYDWWKCVVLFSFRMWESSTAKIAKKNNNIFVFLLWHLFSIEHEEKLGETHVK